MTKYDKAHTSTQTDPLRSLVWLQLLWPHRNCYTSVAQKELVPIVIACILWGAPWRGARVTVHCDNNNGSGVGGELGI